MGRPEFTGPLGTVRTLYTITARRVNPLSISIEWRMVDRKARRTVANRFVMTRPQSTLYGTIGFIADLRMQSVIANVDSALRMQALLFAVMHPGMSGGGRAVLPRRSLQATGARSTGTGYPRPKKSGGAKPEPVPVRIQLGWVPSDHIWVGFGGPGASGLPDVPGLVAHRKGARNVRRPDRRRSGEVGSR